MTKQVVGRRKLVTALGAGAALAVMPHGAARAIERVAELSATKTKLKPVLDGGSSAPARI